MERNGGVGRHAVTRVFNFLPTRLRWLVARKSLLGTFRTTSCYELEALAYALRGCSPREVALRPLRSNFRSVKI